MDEYSLHVISLNGGGLQMPGLVLPLGGAPLIMAPALEDAERRGEVLALSALRDLSTDLRTIEISKLSYCIGKVSSNVRN